MTTVTDDKNSKKDDNSYHNEGGTQNANGTTFRVLLVDDDPDILLTFKKGLEDDYKSRLLGKGVRIHVDTFADPKQALSFFKAGVYDLLFLDIRMPNINGFELYRELQKIDDKPKVCFITAYELYYEALKKDFPMLDVGCFIKKPISIEDLTMKIRKELA